MTPSKPQINPRKQPNQARAAATVEVLLEATARILETQGLTAINTNAIAEKAGVSVGSLYQYFPGKDALVAELLRRERAILQQGVLAIARQSADLSLEEAVLGLLKAAVSHQIERPALSRALEYAETLLPLDEEARVLNFDIVANVAEVLAGHGVKEADVVARDVVAITKGMVDAAGLAGETEASILLERLKRAVFGYLSYQETLK